MFNGHIDVVTSSGYIDGWAWDTDHPALPLIVSLRNDAGYEVAWGSAYRYRNDLAAANCAYGWCAFHLRLALEIPAVLNVRLTLLDRASAAEIYQAEGVPFVEERDASLFSLEDLNDCDPTALKTIDQLRGCEELFSRFIHRNGVDAFVRAAYVYILARAADVTGRARYGHLLRQNSITPFSLLLLLSESEEFRSRPRSLAPPNRSGFLFHAN